MFAVYWEQVAINHKWVIAWVTINNNYVSLAVIRKTSLIEQVP